MTGQINKGEVFDLESGEHDSTEYSPTFTAQQSFNLKYIVDLCLLNSDKKSICMRDVITYLNKNKLATYNVVQKSFCLSSSNDFSDSSHVELYED
jgi:hypothetical protein